MNDSAGARAPARSTEPDGGTAIAARSTHEAGGRPPVAQSRSGEPSGHATTSTPEAEPHLPFLTRTKP